MTSQLAKQLQKLQVRSDGDARLSESFLFSKADARSFSREQVHQLAVAGLQTLTTLDNRFHPFIADLFDPSKARQERTMLSSGESKTLGARIEGFLTLLSPHLFLTAAQQAFEYLVRVHEVHVHNVSAVLRAFLPFHDHNIFSRAVLLLDLRDTGFDFLATNQERGAAMPRELLCIACADSRKALRLVCMTAAMPVRLGVQNNAANALFASVATSLATHADAESIWRVLLPFVVEFLHCSGAGGGGGGAGGETTAATADAPDSAWWSEGITTTTGGGSGPAMNREAVCTALLVLAAWSAESTFSLQMLSTVVKPIIALLRSPAVSTGGNTTHNFFSSLMASAGVPFGDLLAILDILFAGQRAAVAQVGFAPQLHALLAAPWTQWCGELSSSLFLEADRAAVAPLPWLLAALLDVALGRLLAARSLVSVPAEVLSFLRCAAEQLPLTDSMVDTFLLAIMAAEDTEEQAAAANKTTTTTSSSFFSDLVGALERRYQRVFDATLAKALAVTDSDDTSKTTTTTTAEAAKGFLARHLGGTRYHLLEVPTTAGGTARKERLPLFACLLHTVPEVRRVAAAAVDGMTLEELCSSSSSSSASTTITTSNSSGGSILELLAHAARYESNSAVAEQFVRTAAAALRLLGAALDSASASDNENEEEAGECDGNNSGGPKRQRSFYLAAVTGLHRALYTMVSGQGASAAARQQLADQLFCPAILTASSCSSSSGDKTAAMKGKGGKKQAAEVAAAAGKGEECPVRASAVYYATMLYLNAAAELTSSSPTSTVAASGNEDEGKHSGNAALRALAASLGAVLKGAFPGMGRATTPTAATATATGGKKTNSDSSSSSDSDSDDDDDDERDKKTKATAGNKAAPSPSSLPAEGRFLAVLESAPLLLCVRAVSAERMRPALAAARAILRDGAAAAAPPAEHRRAAVECVLACAAALSQQEQQPTTAEGEMDARTVVLRFLLGSIGGSDAAAAADPAEDRAKGYLQLLQESQRAQARHGAVGSGAATDASSSGVGRGAKNSFLNAAYLPTDGVTAALAAAVQAAVRLALAATKTASTTAAAVDVLPLLRLLGFLAAPLPALAENTRALPAALLALADGGGAAEEGEGDDGISRDGGVSAMMMASAQDAFGVDWFGLVHAAVYGPAGLRTFAPIATATTDEKDDTAGLGALAACLLLPLRAPASLRLKCLQHLQDAILRATTKTTVTPDHSSVRLVVAAAMTAGLCDMMSVSSVVEAMAKEESRYRVTNGGARLLSRMLAATTAATALPFKLATDVVKHFFAVPAASGATAAAPRAALDLYILWPRLQLMLTAAAGPRPSKKTKGTAVAVTAATTAASAVKGAGSEVTVAAAEFIEAVCRRCAAAQTTTTNATSGSVSDEPSVRLCSLLLRHPFLSVAGGVRPVYRAALTNLAVALQRGLAADAGRSQLIFKKAGSKAKGSSSSSAAADTAAAQFAEGLAAVVAPIAINAVAVVGSDVGRLCVGTVGGYERIFRPFLERCSASGSGALSIEDGEAMVAFLDALAPGAFSSGDNAAGQWQPPAECLAGAPLTFVDATAVLALAKPAAAAAAVAKGKRRSKADKKDDADEEAAGDAWPRSAASLRSLRLLSALLRAAPAVCYDDDEDGESLLALVTALLSAYPLDKMLPLLTPSSDDATGAAAVLDVTGDVSGALMELYPRQVLGYLRDLVTLCVEQPHALAESDARGPYRLRGAILKQALVLMAALLLNNNDKSEEEDAVEAEMSRARVDIIAELLRALAPLLGPAQQQQDGSSSSTSPSSQPQASFLLHIPIAALLVRLESVEYSAALRYRSAADTCREIITSFDVHTQVSTVTQLMRLVIDPQAQLSNEECGGGGGCGADAADGETLAVLKLFRKMVKPNQIINRQEQLLEVITTTVKSDAFLTPFIKLQHKNNSSSRKKGGDGDDDDGDDADDEDGEKNDGGNKDEAKRKADEGTTASEACMRLLLASLELFSHYSDLNTATANDATNTNSSSNSGLIFGEGKSYTMLLELLSGNALACVLAGINEPTFVECQLRLLGDRRTTLQVKGLEVLLDRLHHSLPTVENTLSDAALEKHRRDLRDPKKKLTLADLVRVKARPLTTKRSFQLMPNLTTLLAAAQQAAIAGTKNALHDAVSGGGGVPLAALLQLYRILQLSTASIEELVRIVASGGSTQAEKTLLNTHRGKRLTEAQLSKLFGNKARVQVVHAYVAALCESAMPALSQCLQHLLRSARKAASFDAETNTTGSAESYAAKAALEEGLMGAMCGLLTSLGTAAQVMGSAFAAPHSIPMLNTIVAAAMFQVADLPAVVARGEAGSLLRHTTLSCLIRVFPVCWQLSQPYLPRIIFAAAHTCNVDDPETSYLSSEVLAVLEALMEPQLFLEAATEGLRGLPYANTAVLPGGAVAVGSSSPSPPSRVIRVQAGSHSFVLLFSCVARRLQGLKKEELLAMPVMTDGSGPSDNFWLAAFQALAAGTAGAAPTAETVQPVLDAYVVFFLKFKPKHCTRLLRSVAEWAFGGDGNKFSKSLRRSGGSNSNNDDDDEEERSAKGNGDGAVPRTVMHGWIIFYALYNHLLEKLGSIVDFSFPTALPYIVGTLQGYCSSTSSSSSSSEKPVASLVALVLEGALDCVRRMSLAQTPGPDYDYSIPLEVLFASDEVFTALMPPLVQQLTNTGGLKDEAHDYMHRAEHAVIPAVRGFFACLNNSKQQARTQAELLRALRHPSRHVRRATLLCLDGVYADGGEELASRLMAEVLPAVVELTEDRDDGVVEEARRLCTNLSHMTGQDVLHAMS